MNEEDENRLRNVLKSHIRNKIEEEYSLYLSNGLQKYFKEDLKSIVEKVIKWLHLTTNTMIVISTIF